MADTVERRVIEVLGKIDQNLAKQLNEVDKSLGRIREQIKQLQQLGVGILGSVVGVEFLTTLGKMADTQTSLRRSLQATIPVGQDLVKTQEDLLDISIRTQQSLEAVTGLYTRLTIAITDVNVKQSELTKTVEAFGATMLIAGTGVREAAAATTQFGQALASGRLQGDEFRSLMENVPVLARVLAENLETANGKFGVTIGQLREMSKAGELVTPKIIEALSRGFDDLVTSTANLPKTIGASITALVDSFGQLIGTADQISGASAIISGAITGLAKFINQHKDVIAEFAGPAVLGLLATSLVAVGIAAVGLFLQFRNFLLAVNPLAGSILILTGVVTAFVAELYRLADVMGLLPAKAVNLDAILGLKDSVSLFKEYENIEKRLGELKDAQNRILGTRDVLESQGATATGFGLLNDLYRQSIEALQENNAEMLKQQGNLELVRERLEEVTKGVDDNVKARKAFNAEREAFAAGTAELREEKGTLQALTSALAVSKTQYDEVKRSQELGAKIAKDWADAQKAGTTASEVNEARVRALSVANFTLNENLEKQIKIQAELAKFTEGAAGAGSKLDDEIALGQALDISAEAYDQKMIAQKAANEVEKESAALIKAGGELLPGQAAAYTALKVAIENQTKANEKKLTGLKNIEKFDVKVKDLQQQVESQRALNEALQVNAQTYEDVKRAQEGTAEVQKEINAAVEAGLPLTADQILKYTQLIRVLSDVTAAGEKLQEQTAAMQAVTDAQVARAGELANIQGQLTATLQGGNAAYEERLNQQKQGAEIEERIKEAQKAGKTGQDLTDFIAQTQKEIALREKNNEVLKDTQEIQKGRIEGAKDQSALNAETQALQAQANAYKQSEKAGQAVERQQEAIRAGMEAANKLSEKDVEGRERAYKAAYDQVLAQEQLKQSIKDTAEARQKADAAAAKAARERLAAIEKEGKDKLALEEKTKRFFEGPVTGIRLDKESAQAQLDQANLINDEERRIAKDKYDDLKQLQAFKLAAAKADQNLSAEYIASVKAEIEEISRLNRETEKRLELNQQLQKIKDEADPFKKLREEKAGIEAGLKAGDTVFINEDEKREAVERLGEIEAAMSKLKVTAEELSAMGNPYASLVNAAAELESVTSDAFANLDPSQKIQEGGEAALQVIAGVNDSLKMLGIENFEVQKGIAIATATINAALAITKVLSQGGAFAIPLAAAIGALAGVQIAMIAAQQPPQRALGGPVGAASMYRVGERGPEMFQSMSGKNYMIPGEGGNVTPANQNGGGNVIINNLGPPITAKTEKDQAGNQVVTIDAAVKATTKVFEQQMAQGYGGFSRGIRKNTNAGRRIA